VTLKKKKLKLKPEELKVVPMSIVLHVFFADEFGFTRMKEILRRFGGIESLQIGIGYLKTVHSKEKGDVIKRQKYPEKEQSEDVLDPMIEEEKSKENIYLESIRTKFYNYLEIGYQKELNQREKEEKEKSEKIGKKIGEKIGEQNENQGKPETIGNKYKEYYKTVKNENHAKKILDSNVRSVPAPIIEKKQSCRSVGTIFFGWR